MNLIELYLDYRAETESPIFFHRWAIITALSAYLGRQLSFDFGFTTIYPNIFTMLVGSPGTKKSTAIRMASDLIKLAGYETFSARKTRQEKFLLDMAEQHEENEEDILEQNLFGTADLANKVTECFIAADEFNNFIGQGNIEFMSILGELYDYNGIYDYRLKNSKSVRIPNPTLTILGGNTPTGIVSIFPQDSIGQGFFSRLFFIYSESTGIKYAFPPKPDISIQEKLIEMLATIKIELQGEVTFTPKAKQLLEKIYEKWVPIEDVRFEYYANRRFVHLIKLCMICSVAILEKEITEQTVVYANTILSYTEQFMPKALGEFGRSKTSFAAHKIIAILDKTHKPLSLVDLWKHVAMDLEQRRQLFEILSNLVMADKIHEVSAGKYLAKKKVMQELIATDYSLLREAK